MNKRMWIIGAAAVLFFALAPNVFAQTSGAATPTPAPRTKPSAPLDDPFNVTPPPAKTTPATKDDTAAKTPAAKATQADKKPDDFPFPAELTPKLDTDKMPAGKPPAAKTDPFRDEPEPGKLVPSPRPSAAPAATSDVAPPLTANPKPLSNEPSDLKSTEVEMAPGQAEFNQGQELAAAGKYAAAIEAYKKSLKLAKNDASTYQALGVAYRMLNSYDDAIAAFTEAIRIQPELAEPYLRRGICWFQKQEYGLAGLDFDDAAGIDFTDPRAATWKGMTLARQGLMLDAVNVYSSALRYDNRFVLGHINRGLAYAALHDYKKAILDFDSAINVTPKDSTIFFKRAVAESSLGDWHAVVNSYNEAIRLDPQYAAAYKNRGEAYRQLGDIAHAQADAQRAQELTSVPDRKSTDHTTTTAARQ